jgi:hypothetical protein
MSRLEMFSKVPIRPKLKHFHPFGCPAYVTQLNNQVGNKWEPRACTWEYHQNMQDQST